VGSGFDPLAPHPDVAPMRRHRDTDPITHRQLYLRSTVKDEDQAAIKSGKLLENASEGR
jgi:hypothetical protein